MLYHFNTKKATQAATVLLRFEDGKMEHLRLLKLLYIADRESLAETGRTISMSKAVAMDHGPLSSDVYDLIKGERSDEAVWSEFIHRHGHNVTLKSDPGRSELSKYEIAKLNEVSERNEHLNTWKLSDLTHEFEEWQKHKPPKGSAKFIPLVSLIEAVGFGPEEKARIIADLTQKSHADQVLADAEP